MPDDDRSTGLSPTVSQVIEQFIADMRVDDGIPDVGVDRLERLVRKGTVPKPEDINAALFPSAPEGRV